MPKEKDRNLIYRKEQEVADRTRGVQINPRLTKEELRKEYRYLAEKYNKMLGEMIKITRVGDMHYKKLMEANEHIQEQKTILEDLTRQLVDANTAKDKFYSILAHDLKNPLQILLFSSELMAEEYKKMDGDAIKKFIEKVNKAAQNMAHLLDNLLQWGRSQYGEIDCNPHTLDLFNLAKETVLYFTENAEKKNIKLYMGIRENTRVYADENMIKSVMRNLVNNAIKFTAPGGMVKIFAAVEGECIVTTVTDSGVGIPAGKLELLFKIGEHFSTRGTAKEKGSGLGLLLCKEFVEKNGGKLEVRSEEGKGSVFAFSLPAYPPRVDGEFAAPGLLSPR